MNPKIGISYNSLSKVMKLLGYCILFSLTIILSYTLIINWSNYSGTFDSLNKYGMSGCFADYFNHSVNCSYRYSIMIDGLPPFLFNLLFVGFIYYTWFSIINSKFHLIGISERRFPKGVEQE